MKKTILTLLALAMVSVTFAQDKADDVMKTLRLANDYFMAKYADPTLPTNVNRVRPSSLWTRAVYYEARAAVTRFIEILAQGVEQNRFHTSNGLVLEYGCRHREMAATAGAIHLLCNQLNIDRRVAAAADFDFFFLRSSNNEGSIDAF